MIQNLTPVAAACATLVGGFYHSDPQMLRFTKWSVNVAKAAGMPTRFGSKK